MNDAAALYRAIAKEDWEDAIKRGRAYLYSANLCDEYYVHQCFSDQASFDVVRVYDSLAAHDLNIFGTFTESAGKTGRLNRSERRVNALAWQRRQARTQRSGSAPITVGAWQAGHATAADRRERPCTVPFLIADIDGPTPDRALPAVKALVGRLVALGVRPDDIVVSYTGGRGLHVRIPHGLVGRPVWPRAAGVSRVVGKFFERVCDGLSTPEGPLYGSLDASLFSPLHLVRAIGSEHDRALGRRCVAYQGDTFLELIGTLGDDGFLDVAETQCKAAQAVPFLVPNPDRSQPVPALQEVLRAAICDVRKLEKSERARGEIRESRGIIDRIRRGVRPGEEFAPGRVGRNYAALLYSLVA